MHRGAHQDELEAVAVHLELEHEREHVRVGGPFVHLPPQPLAGEAGERVLELGWKCHAVDYLSPLLPNGTARTSSLASDCGFQSRFATVGCTSASMMWE